MASAAAFIVLLTARALWNGQPKTVRAVRGHGGFVAFDGQSLAPRANGKYDTLLDIRDSCLRPLTKAVLVGDARGVGGGVNPNPFNRELLRRLAATPSLRELVFYQALVTDDDLEQLRPLRSLNALCLYDCKRGVGDPGMQHLAQLTNLQELRVDNSAVTDQGLMALANLTALEVLSLTDAHVTDAGMTYVSRLASLRELYIGTRGGNITDHGMAALSGLGNLEVLAIDGTSVSDRGLQHLKGLRNLALLSYDGTPITEDGVVALGLTPHPAMKGLAER